MAGSKRSQHTHGMVSFPPQTAIGITRRSDVALYELFSELADLAERISLRAGELTEPAELALAASALEGTAAALARGVERAAYSLGDSARGGAPAATPLPQTARAVSWRLHGLAGALRRCRELSGVVEEAVERSRVGRLPAAPE
jgi:hypothetical protein